MPRKRKDADDVKDVLSGGPPLIEVLGKEDESQFSKDNLLSSGSTLLNLACSNNPYGAFLKGKYYFLVGDSASGKTFLSMTCFAEADRNPAFADYDLYYDNVEDGMLIDLEAMFNERVAKKILPPSGYKTDPQFSSTIEEFYYNLDDCLSRTKDNGRGFIYVLDSMDGLTSESEVDKFTEHKEAHKKGKSAAGSYGDGKAKRNSEGLRKVLRGLQDTGSILIIVSQTRDNLGFGFKTKSRAGGHALRFYATLEVWSSVKGQIKKTVKGKPRNIGSFIGLKIEKNRQTGKVHDVVTHIYPSYGIDDLGSCVEWLLSEGFWSKNGNTIDATEDLGISGSASKIIGHIEENDLEEQFQEIIGRYWKELDKACSLERKNRYAK